MSLRDQLLKSGLVSKKKAREVERELKRARKKEQGKRDSKGELRVLAREAKRAEKAAARAKKRAETRARQAERDAVEAKRTVRNLLMHYQVRWRPGPQFVWHRTPHPTQLHRLALPESLAMDLVNGGLAVAWVGTQTDPDFVLVPAAVAARVAKHDPGRVLFCNASPPTDPAEQLLGS